MRALSLLLAAVLTVPAAAASSAPPEPPVDTITVTGTRSDPAAVHAQATAFIHATGVAAGEVPAARWAEPICPRAYGLTDTAAQQKYVFSREPTTKP